MNNIKKMNEFLGFSEKEKEAKQRKLDIEQLKKELSNYNWLRMTAQPDKDWKNEDLRKLVEIRIAQGKRELPYLYKLMPELFKLKSDGTNAFKCYFRMGDRNEPYGDRYEGIVPSNFSFIIDPETRTVENTDKTGERVMKYIIGKLSI